MSLAYLTSQLPEATPGVGLHPNPLNLKNQTWYEETWDMKIAKVMPLDK